MTASTGLGAGDFARPPPLRRRPPRRRRRPDDLGAVSSSDAGAGLLSPIFGFAVPPVASLEDSPPRRGLPDAVDARASSAWRFEPPCCSLDIAFLPNNAHLGVHHRHGVDRKWVEALEFGVDQLCGSDDHTVAE